MRYWFDYLPKKVNVNTLNRFEFTDEVLIQNYKNYKERFIFDKFKDYELSHKTYNYFKKKLEKKSTFFIGSSWGWVEFFLSKNFSLIASDVNEKYVNFHKDNKDFKYIKFDILDMSEKKEFNNKFEQVIVNNIEYLFDQDQIQKCMRSVNYITKKDADIFFIFRSRDSFIIKIIDNYLLPFENKLKTILKNFKKDKQYLTKNHHGFRRNEKEFIKIIEEGNFKVQSVYKDMFEVEYNRLTIIRMLKISKFLSIIFFKLHPHLNIFHTKKNGL